MARPWNLEGWLLVGRYLGNVPVEGICVMSRVKYGGDVDHHIQLSKPVEVYGTLRDHVILHAEEVKFAYRPEVKEEDCVL